MTLSPSRRLLFAAGAWLTIAVTATAWPAFELASAAAALLLIAAALLDGAALWRRPMPELARTLPERAWQGRPASFQLILRNLSKVRFLSLIFELCPKFGVLQYVRASYAKPEKTRGKAKQNLKRFRYF